MQGGEKEKKRIHIFPSFDLQKEEKGKIYICTLSFNSKRRYRRKETKKCGSKQFT